MEGADTGLVEEEGMMAEDKRRMCDYCFNLYVPHERGAGSYFCANCEEKRSDDFWLGVKFLVVILGAPALMIFLISLLD